MGKKPDNNKAEDTVGNIDRKSGKDRFQMGKRLRQLRKKQGWTLTDVSQRTGLAVSTLSKAERGEMSMTYDKFMQLAMGLGIDVGELFSNTGRQFTPKGVEITRAGDAAIHETDTYTYQLPASGLRDKQMTPMFGRLKAHSIKQFKDNIHHPGEEFLYVLSGRVEVHIEGQETFTLNPRESAYFDSGMSHAYVSVGEEDAEILVVCWQPPHTTLG